MPMLMKMPMPIDSPAVFGRVPPLTLRRHTTDLSIRSRRARLWTYRTGTQSPCRSTDLPSPSALPRPMRGLWLKEKIGQLRSESRPTDAIPTLLGSLGSTMSSAPSSASPTTMYIGMLPADGQDRQLAASYMPPTPEERISPRHRSPIQRQCRSPRHNIIRRLIM